MSTIFSPEIYRKHNLDLRHLPDDEAVQHFQACSHERRIYGKTDSTASFMSMRWLRGEGVEVGAGGYPTPLFGNAKAIMADCDDDLAFGGDRIDLRASLDSPEFARVGKVFDFAIASHVLEHADSFIRALENLAAVTKKGGIVYVVLPDIDFLNDKNWMPYFDFRHHEIEYEAPLAFADVHDGVYIAATKDSMEHMNDHANLSDAYKAALRSGKLPQEMRFMHHKHNYCYEGWIELILQAKHFLAFNLVDTRYGHERFDCHFALKVAS